MEQLLFWYSKNNSLIIQSLAVVIGLLLCFFIFKLFFGQNHNVKIADAPSPQFQNSGTSSEQIESKINQIFESQSKKKLNTNSDIPATSDEAAALIEKIQNENLNLKQIIKDQENIKNSTTPVSGIVTNQSASDSDVGDYKKQIEELKNRLSDYEVIAEDIADLHKLREENQKLLLQIQNGSSADVSKQPPNSQEISADDISGLLSGFAGDSTTDIQISENTVVTDQDKNLIEQFEKSKGT